MARRHGKDTRFYMDGYDLSGDSNSFEPRQMGETVEVSTFTDTSKTYVVGLKGSEVRLAGVFNDAANQIHAVGSGRVGSSVVLDGVWGDVRGGHGGGGPVKMTEYSVTSAIAGAVSVVASFQEDGSTGPFEFTTVLLPKGAAPTGDGTTGVDLGASFVAANGTVAGHCQFFSGTGTIVVQSSTAAGTVNVWTTRATVAAGVSPTGSRVLYNGGTVAEFWRAHMTAGTGTAWVGIARVA